MEYMDWGGYFVLVGSKEGGEVGVEHFVKILVNVLKFVSEEILDDVCEEVFDLVVEDGCGWRWGIRDGS